MSIDHINRIFFANKIYLAFCLGRLAFPLFAFVFAYNLVNNLTLNQESYLKIAKRALVFGVLATPAYRAMLGIQGLFPLNILFTFLAAFSCIFLYAGAAESKELKTSFHSKGPLVAKPRFLALAFCFFLLGGGLVEYYWFGLFLCFSFWLFCKQVTVFSTCLLSLAFFLLNELNGNSWALASLPLIALAFYLELKLPRLRYFFWIYYPLHLNLLLLLRFISERFF